MMRRAFTTGVGFAVICAASIVVAHPAGAEISRSDVTVSLRAIKRVADDVASGKYRDKAHLRGPARTIAIEWGKAEPVLSHRSSLLVETRIANRAIAAFERDWKKPAAARSSAKDVSDAIASLVDARKTYASPIP